MKAQLGGFALLSLCGLAWGQAADLNRWQWASPGVDAPLRSGFANPAGLGQQQGLHLSYDWQQQEQQWLAERWQIQGPGVLYARELDQNREVNHQLGLGLGNGHWSLGYGYQWPGRDNQQDQSSQRLGALYRPNAYVSLGLVGHWSEHAESPLQLDLGIRPFADPRLSLYGEWWPSEERRSSTWSLGAQSQLAGHWTLAANYHESADSRGVSIGLGYQFSGLGLGVRSQWPADQARIDHYQVSLGGQPQFMRPSRSLGQPRLWLELAPQGPLGHRGSTFFEPGESLLAMQQLLDLAAKDPELQGVLVNTTNLQLNSSMAWELSQSLAVLRDQGKEVVLFIERGGMAHLQLMASATQVYLDPMGSLHLPGFVSSRMFVSEALAHWGIGVESISSGEYKSLAEGSTRRELSAADREQRQALLQSNFAQLSQDLAGGRDLAAIDLLALFDDNLFLSPEQLEARSLVDGLERYSALKDRLAESLSYAPRYLSSQELRARHNPVPLWGPASEVVVLYALGEVSLDSGMRTRWLAEQLKSLAEDDQVLAIVLRVDSPGGDILASDYLSEQVQAAAQIKPVLVSMSSVSASGGYWVSMYADRIYATPQTVTGSIGVAYSYLWDQGLSAKLGFSLDHVAIGGSADLSSGLSLPLVGNLPHRALNDDERARLQARSQYYYDDFVRQAADGRAMPQERMDRLAQGRIYSGRDAQENGLVDELASLIHVVASAKAMAGQADNRSVRVREVLPSRQRSGFDLLEALGMSASHYSNPVQDYLQFVIQHPQRPLALVPLDVYQEVQ